MADNENNDNKETNPGGDVTPDRIIIDNSNTKPEVRGSFKESTPNDTRKDTYKPSPTEKKKE